LKLATDGDETKLFESEFQCLINISFIRNKCRDKEHKEKIKAQKCDVPIYCRLCPYML